MPGELELVLSEFLYALDSKDVDSMIRNIADDAQSVDEISRRWLLGRGEVEDYLASSWTWCRKSEPRFVIPTSGSGETPAS